MFDWMIIGFLALAIAVGYGLGVYRSKPGREATTRTFADTYYQGLRYIINEQTDSSVDAFIESLAVNEETLEIHLALGSLLRRKGDVTRAIKIHEHLLHCGKLNRDQLHQAQLELACDFVSAGLLDRAENLFEELVRLGSKYTAEALQHLVVIYQNEREWDKAIRVATELSSRPNKLGTNELAIMRSHYCCELALQAIESDQVPVARGYLQEAFHHYQNSVRASLIWARLEFDAGAYGDALALLKKIPMQDPELINQSLDLLCQCFYALGDKEGLRHYLFGLLTRHPCNSIILKVAEIVNSVEGEQAAVEFIAAQLRHKPSIRTLSRLVELYLVHADDKSRENLELLKYLIDKVVAEKPSYICSKCGFTGHELHWLCPSCKSWGVIKPIKGVAGE
jgi:lipopolysaccharide biosynthesis regulator YciM